MRMREPEVIIADIKHLIQSQGYFYALCSILLEEFTDSPEELHKKNPYLQLGINEASLLLGFLVQDRINLSLPRDIEEFNNLKKNTYLLLTELHKSLSEPLQRYAVDDESVSKGTLFIEGTFYAGTGAYDLQYLDFLEKKYCYDAAWLKASRGFVFHEVRAIFKRIREISNEKYKNPEIQNLLELCTIKKNDIEQMPGGGQFIENFMMIPGVGLNERFHGPGDYNLTRSHPLIELDDEILFLPVPFILAEAIYESPFYWMMEDDEYKPKSETNRGKAGEDITFQLLQDVFGKDTQRDVKISSKKGQTETDIDILCVLGNKALCVQVKSKKMTELSRRGGDEALKRDFQTAVQEAYEQAKVTRQRIFDRSSKFFDNNGKEIHLSEGINEVYLLAITAENFPSLAHQVRYMLKKEEDDPHPLVMTIFDLELVAHYLSDPFDFLYYVRQRVETADYFSSDEEGVYLGFHLTEKLWKLPGHSRVSLPNVYAQWINRDYHPFKLGLKLPQKTNPLSTAMQKDADFDALCGELKSCPDPVTTDILFNLFDLSEGAQNNFMKAIETTRMRTKRDERDNMFSYLPPFQNGVTPRFGISYFSSKSPDALEEKLLDFCIRHKNKSRCDSWLGLAGLQENSRWIDCLIYIDDPWKYDQLLEEETQKTKSVYRSAGDLSKKYGWKDLCPCGSGRKYKKCCIGKL